ncbi:MAG: aromatic ring-hydroxylating oxygenase subunit alpha [Burkholderiaceae bacterium]
MDSQPATTATSLPPECYVDPGFEVRERSDIFARSWQLVAHASQLGAAGDHVVAEIAGVPLVVVRGSDGILRALHNVCRHRAGPVALCDGRGARSLTCKYHGWSYELDGQLRGAPDMRDVPGFEISAIQLPQASVAEWQGLVFAALEASAPFESIVAGIDTRLEAGATANRLFGYVRASRVSYEIDCNWKVYVDNFLEGYHLPVVHPALNRLLNYRQYRTELAPWHSLQWSPLEQAQGPYGAGEALYYWLFPNTMLNVLPGRLQTNRVLPLGPQRCRVDFDYYYPADAPPAAADSDRVFADEVQAEDTAICEAVQRGLASGSYVAGRLNPTRESGVWHFHELLRAAFRSTSA